MISKYIIGVLIALLLLFGGLSYDQNKEIKQLKEDVRTYKQASEDNLKAKEDSDTSCKVTVDSLNAFYKEQAQINSAKEGTTGKIDKLPNLTIKEKKNEAPKPSQEHSDDDRLSPDIMRLLDEAYCHGNKDNCTKTPN